MPKITKILWTWSWNGFVVGFDNGDREPMGAEQLLKLVGSDTYARLNRIAHQFPTGCFHKVG